MIEEDNVGNHRNIISLEEAQSLREQLRPAFAGYVTDGNISDRDVLATLMDLIVRGKIGMDADTQKKPVKVNRVYWLGDGEGLLPFEKEFIATLFTHKKELSADEVHMWIDSKELHEVIFRNLEFLQNFGIAKSLLLVEGERRIYRGQLYLTIPNTKKKRPVRTLEDLDLYREQVRSNAWSWLVLLGFIFLIFSIRFLPFLKYNPAIGNIWLLVAILPLFAIIYGVIKLNGIRYLKKFLELQFNNNIIPFTKKRYEDLFDFIQSYPLKEQRLYNEFMPHAVALGLDTSWNESFGIGKEIVVKSKAVSAKDLNTSQT